MKHASLKQPFLKQVYRDKNTRKERVNVLFSFAQCLHISYHTLDSSLENRAHIVSFLSH